MKIACMGDSITLGVGLPGHQGRWSDLVAEATGHELVNFGIGGDTTGGMLARCQYEVFHRDFDAMILLGGTNDICYSWEYRTAWANTIALYRQAKAYGIPLIMGIPVPAIAEDLVVRDYYPGRDNEKISALVDEFGRMLTVYCREKEVPFADFRSAFLDESGKGRRELFFDGLHPTAEGHRLMARVLTDTLARLEVSK